MVCLFFVVQPKALSAYKNIVFENCCRSNEKLPIEGKADKISAEIIIERGFLPWSSEVSTR